jgi:Arc/MetJ-type ribon-helix-helix transcriptional regulator
MSIEISPENERFIERQIARGAFRNRGEVLDAGIELLRMRDDLLERVDRGRNQLDTGEFTDYDEAALKERFEQLKARTRRMGRDPS